ncbi:RTA1-domain-containing protein [Aaosphaeria arxii CBS 175.79]|uniref:RTA1-domain-containing protein n=1 Tax=Aaosphaeria arxii CBS 175.79 TaxID=1450172 RepID=A0A6A5XPE0_9PLEO|nr:RTA1-domain-containing protein [Aaosphaeria arxii CBS 175.79]KAF2014214.1 RTA1-domain-containing protein [Aaosphaeria arxii CBS 175.79]
MAEQYRPSLDDPNAWVPYRYVPSMPAAVVFVVLFAITTAFHTFQLVKKRTWYFIPLVLGGFCEVIGYVGRILGHKDMWALGPFIMQSILILIAPAFFAASIYIILGRVILMVDGERFSLIKQRRLTSIFVTGDVLSLFMQSGGGGIQGMKTASSMKMGEKIIIGGLVVQLLFFGFFIVVAALFQRRLTSNQPVKRHLTLKCWGRSKETGTQRLSGTPGFASNPVNPDDLPWKRHIYTLYGASTLILIRSIFRVVEYIQGNHGYLLRREYFLYIFDAVLMFIVMILFNWVHPSEVTDIYNKRLNNQSDVELQGARDEYLGHEFTVEQTKGGQS